MVFFWLSSASSAGQRLLSEREDFQGMKTKPTPKTHAIFSCSRRQAEVLGRKASRTCRRSRRNRRLEGDRRLAAICRRHTASRGFEPRSLDSDTRVLTVTPRGQLRELPVMLSWLLLPDDRSSGVCYVQPEDKRSQFSARRGAWHRGENRTCQAPIKQIPEQSSEFQDSVTKWFR